MAEIVDESPRTVSMRVCQQSADTPDLPSSHSCLAEDGGCWATVGSARQKWWDG